MMETSLTYPFINDSCEDVMNFEHKKIKLMREFAKQDEINIADDLMTLMLGDFCISPGCKKHLSDIRECAHVNDR
jgi:hypothetical protein